MDNPNAQEFLGMLLGKQLRVHTTDTRMFIGEFKCTDNFDDRQTSLLPGINQVGVYKGLFYNAFDLSNKGLGLGGVVAHSNPNVAVTTMVTSQALRSTPTLTVDYNNTNSIQFAFSSSYFGCNAPTAQGIASAAVQCSILVAGFNAANKEIDSATFTFTPPAKDLVSAPLIQAKLPSTFVGLHNVTIVQSSPRPRSWPWTTFSTPSCPLRERLEMSVCVAMSEQH
ncbi:MAG: hypothetical protein LQ338_001223 [Usnochroma carphineum]|nr:MAG: hypothetical protein LQ338_001223 [Usnochroma carphineum]